MNQTRAALTVLMAALDDQDTIITLLQTISRRLHHMGETQATIAATVADIKNDVVTLQAAVDTKQEAIASAILGLNTTIAELKDQLAAGGTPDQAALDALGQSLADIKAGLEAVTTDVAETPVPEAAPVADSTDAAPPADTGAN